MTDPRRNKAANGFRGISFYDIIRRAGTALLTPIHFSRTSGHFRSSIKRKAVDSSGNCIPWYTYPAIDFLTTMDFSEKAVLEFGAGHSTVWWSQRAKSVLSIEEDRVWFNYLRSKLETRPNVELVLSADNDEYANRPLGRKFDIIIIDGGPRNRCAESALSCINVGGAIVLDDSEGFWGGETNHSYPIIDLYSAHGFMRVDFYGYAPGVLRRRCTSLFLKEGTQMLKDLPPPRRR